MRAFTFEQNRNLSLRLTMMQSVDASVLIALDRDSFLELRDRDSKVKQSLLCEHYEVVALRSAQRRLCDANGR
jgi:hypothetical protein